MEPKVENFVTHIVLILASVLLLGLGIIGLIIPIIPGILFLILAGVLLSTVFPGLRKKLRAHSRFDRLFNRLDRGEGLSMMTRCKLMFWAILESFWPTQDPVHRKYKPRR